MSRTPPQKMRTLNSVQCCLGTGQGAEANQEEAYRVVTMLFLCLAGKYTDRSLLLLIIFFNMLICIIYFKIVKVKRVFTKLRTEESYCIWHFRGLY